MTRDTEKDERDRAELERRLSLLEGPRRDEMVQADLPVRDLVWLVAVLVIVSALLGWWAR